MKKMKQKKVPIVERKTAMNMMSMLDCFRKTTFKITKMGRASIDKTISKVTNYTKMPGKSFSPIVFDKSATFSSFGSLTS